MDESDRHSVLSNLEKILQNNGIYHLYDELKIIDKESAEKYSDKNPRRIIRAWEYYKAI